MTTTDRRTAAQQEGLDYLTAAADSQGSYISGWYMDEDLLIVEIGDTLDGSAWVIHPSGEREETDR